MKVSDFLINPKQIGRISGLALVEKKITYTRNGTNVDLRKYAKELWQIPHDKFHFEEIDDKGNLLVIDDTK
jgi:hypothetical protein